MLTNLDDAKKNHLASLKLTLKMVETNTQSSSLEVDPDTDMKANVDFMRTNSYRGGDWRKPFPRL